MNLHDKQILRALAEQVAEIASLPVQAQKRELWRKHNDLEDTRPLVFCDPENGWNEIILDSDLQCTDCLARTWEWSLRQKIFWGTKMNDDKVIEPYFDTGLVTNSTGWGREKLVHGGENGHSYSWEPLIKSYEDDCSWLHFPEYSVNWEESERRIALANEIFQDILTVRHTQGWWWTLGLTSTLIEFRGLENYMFDMYDYPDELHKLMEFLCDGTIKMIDDLEKKGLLYSNANDSYVGSGGFGYTNQLPAAEGDGSTTAKNMWGFCESQETVGVSPEMFGEFVFPYHKRIMSKFGLNCYGCCEPLDVRWDWVKQLPNLRRVSVSPWCSIPDMAEKLQNKYVYSMKPNPSYIAVPSPDFASIRKELEQAVKVTRNCHVEIIMKDNHTIGKNPNNVIEWTRIAKEIAEGC